MKDGEKSNMYVTRIPEKKGEIRASSIFDEILYENYPELMKNTALNSENSQRIAGRAR